MKTFQILRPLLEIGVVVFAIVFGLRFITSFFSQKSKVYRPTFLRQFYLLFWPLLCLGVGLPNLGFYFYTTHLAGYEVILLLGLGAVLLGFSMPALLLHAQYYARNLHTTLVFEPKENRLEVYEGRVRIPFRQSELVRVERVTCKSRRLFWSNYDFLRLHLRTGETLTLTSLLVNLAPLSEFLRSTPLEHRQRWFCWT